MTLTIIFYLILGHLLGDFVFQPTKLVIWKNRSKWGLLTHVLIHFIITLILLSPILAQGNLWLLIPITFVILTHFFVDQSKILYDKDLKHHNKLKPFLIDQLMHLIILFTAFILITLYPLTLHSSASSYYLPELPLYFSVLILSTNAFEIYLYEKAITQKRTHHIKFINKKALIKATFITIIFFLYLLIRY